MFQKTIPHLTRSRVSLDFLANDVIELEWSLNQSGNISQNANKVTFVFTLTTDTFF